MADTDTDTLSGTPEVQDAHESVQEYYGRILQTTSDLKTSACCTAEAIPAAHREILALLDDEIMAKTYGCGSPIPPALEGCTVLDLGSGAGRDSYLCSYLVGESGRVIGVDMTEEQLDVARRHADAQTKAFGYSKTNVDFRQGYIEDLAACGVEDNSVDVVISNCVINLSPAKDKVFSELFRVLKPGGELYFSDVFSDRRVPEHVRADPVLYGECLGGAMYTEDFRRTLLKLGCPDYRVVNASTITIEDEELNRRAGMINFFSLTVRAFKLDSLEDICEDYGQVATYKGTVAAAPHSFILDDHHEFIAGKPMTVCGNTAAMIEETRYGAHFEVTGDRSTHYGPFDCGPDPTANGSSPAGNCC